VAPFASLIKDPDVYERFETIILVTLPASIRTGLWRELVARFAGRRVVRPLLADKLLYTNRHPRAVSHRGRITDLITSEQLFGDLGLPPPISKPTGSCCAAARNAGRAARDAGGARFFSRQSQRARPFCYRKAFVRAVRGGLDFGFLGIR